MSHSSQGDDYRPSGDNFMFARTLTLALLTWSLSLALGCAKVQKPDVVQAEAQAEPATAAEVAQAETKGEAAKSDAKQAGAVAETSAATAARAESPAPAVAAETAKPSAETTPSTQTADAGDQVAQTKSAPKQPAPQPAAPQPPTKQEILNSPEWRRAMFEFSEWLTAQTIYTPAQVAQIKDQFNHRVAAMDANELAYMLNDMEAKFHVMSTPEAREARAWMAQYLSVLSDRKRAELLKDVPNIATMTAAQLNAEIQKIIEKRQTLEDDR